MSEKPKHPKGLYVLFFTEMWERFSFYLLLGILYLYMTDSEKGGLGWTDVKASSILGTYIALVYFTPFIGGLLADRLLGCRRTIVIGGVLMMLGHLVLAIPTELGLYGGLFLVILGNGAFKPNISTLVGNLYPPGSPIKDAGYNIFYMGINLGAFACNFIAALVRNYFDDHPIMLTPELKIEGWHAAFSTAAFGMLLGLITFLLNFKGLEKADTDPNESDQPKESLKPLWFHCMIPALILGGVAAFGSWYYIAKVKNDIDHLFEYAFNPTTAGFLGACIPVIYFYIRIWSQLKDEGDRGRTGGLLVIFGVVIVFWMIFHLNSTALTAWTKESTSRKPNSVVRLITKAMPEFTENAKASYYYNAAPDVPRPSKETLEVISQEKYDELKEKGELGGVKEDKPILVTEEMVKKIYQHEGDPSKRLEKGKHLQVVNTELFQSINPGYVILFTPLVVGVWSLLRSRGKEPSTSAKIGIGMFLTACGPLVMCLATLATNDGNPKAIPAWLFGTYAMVTLGELCLSPMGLSLVNKMAPANIRAFMMGGWFVATAFGNKLSGIFGELYNKDTFGKTPEDHHVMFWLLLMCMGLLFGGIIFALRPWLNRQMVEKKYDEEVAT